MTGSDVSFSHTAPALHFTQHSIWPLKSYQEPCKKADTNIVLRLCISNLAAPTLPILTSERRSRCAGGWHRWQGCSAPHFRAMERAPGRHYGPEPTSHVAITKVIKPQHHLVIWQITFPVIKCNIATRSAMHLGEGGDLNWTPIENLLSLHLKTVHSTTRTVSAMETTVYYSLDQNLLVTQKKVPNNAPGS